MSLAPKPQRRARQSIFSGKGVNTAKLSLIEAVYFDRTDTAANIIRTDPDQINMPEPFAGLTALHIAVFRQNAIIVDLLTTHPVTDIHVKDRFGRSPIDMCIYTNNHAIFTAIMERTYQKPLLDLDNDGDTIVPLKPEG